MRYLSRTSLLVLAIFSAIASDFGCNVGRAEEMSRFITRRGDQLLDGDKPYRFISVNIPNLLVIEDAFSFAGKNPWRWPDEFEIEDALESVRQMGGQVVR